MYSFSVAHRRTNISVVRQFFIITFCTVQQTKQQYNTDIRVK